MFYFFVYLSSCVLYHNYEEKSFLSWMRSTNQFYTGDEYFLRFGIYLTNSRFVKEHNKANKYFKLALNKFAVYTPSEYRSLLGLRQKAYQSKAIKSTKKHNAESLDWRDKGVVNPVQDQGQCGSCWAFSAIQAIESSNAIKTGQLYKFSEQDQIDCNTFCSGCHGGLMMDVFQWTMHHHNGTFCLQKDYPYTATEGTCNFDNVPHYGTISNFDNIFLMDEEDLFEKVQIGPVSVGIDASTASFQLYSEGIFSDDDCSSLYLDHGVGCVGYGSTSDGTDFWIVRNSWGADWGENGYVRMLRGENMCGIATTATIPYA